MSDSYLAISQIANDEWMLERMTAAAVQQTTLGNINVGTNPQVWISEQRYVWACSPSWGEKWSSALAGGIEEPGKDESVITDADILTTVQHLGGASTE